MARSRQGERTLVGGREGDDFRSVFSHVNCGVTGEPVHRGAEAAQNSSK